MTCLALRDIMCRPYPSLWHSPASRFVPTSSETQGRHMAKPKSLVVSTEASDDNGAASSLGGIPETTVDFAQEDSY